MTRHSPVQGARHDPIVRDPQPTTRHRGAATTHLTPQLSLSVVVCTEPDVDPEMFFPAEGDSAAVDAARALCRRCPSVRHCVGYALTHDVDGIWGGTTYAHREQLRARHHITAEPLFPGAEGAPPITAIAS